MDHLNGFSFSVPTGYQPTPQPENPTGYFPPPQQINSSSPLPIPNPNPYDAQLFMQNLQHFAPPMAPPMPLPTPQPILMQQQMQQQPPPSTPSILSPSFTNLPPTPAPPLTLPMPTMGGGIPPALQESQDSLKRKRDEESVAPPKPKPIVGLDSRRGDDRRAKKNASARARQKVKKERTERLLEQVS